MNPHLQANVFGSAHSNYFYEMPFRNLLMTLQVDAVLKKINKYTSEPDFTPEAVGKVSGAARGLCLWVREN